MERRPSSDIRNTLLFAFGVGALFNLAASAHIDHALWRNIYFRALSSANPYNIGFSVFLVIACAFTSNTGQSRRLWRASLVLVAALAAVILAAGGASHLLPRVGVFDSFQAGIVGLAFSLVLVDGTPARVWRDLTTKGTDYAGRFFPLTGCLSCLAFVGLWGDWLYRQWSADADVVMLDGVCFVLGMVCMLIGGHRRDIPPGPAVPIEA